MAERPDWVNQHNWPTSTDQVQQLLDYTSGLEKDNARLAAELAGARDHERWTLVDLRQLEWDTDTDVHQCAWCLGWQQHGHLEECKFAALLARLGGGA